MKTAATLDELINIALTKENTLVKFYMGELTESEVRTVKNVIGINLDTYKHVVDNYAIRHVITNHGDKIKEIQRGQIAISVEDLRLIPQVIKLPEVTVDEGLNRVGRRVVRYEKTICNERFYYVAEIREKHAEFAMQTMYKRKAFTFQ